MDTDPLHRHIPVLRNQAVDFLNLTGNDCVVDATLGQGGHSDAILSNLSFKSGRLIGIDRDPEAIRFAERKWRKESRVEIIHSLFSNLSRILNDRGLLGKVTAIIFDLGVSSTQLDDKERGFSFMRDGPLDMRMDQSTGIAASLWLKQVNEKNLISVLKRYGEERFARIIAHKIKTALKTNSITTTRYLSKIVEETIPTQQHHKHPATRIFQAIRIKINDELRQIELVLPQILKVLAPGGRVVMISFHSLEDRMVKQFFKRESQGDPYPPDIPVTNDMLKPTLRLIGKPVKAGCTELNRNRRARSAVMRVAEKIL